MPQYRIGHPVCLVQDTVSERKTLVVMATEMTSTSLNVISVELPICVSVPQLTEVGGDAQLART